MTRRSALAAVAARQHHTITTAQLRSLGFTRDAIAHLRRTDRIFPVYRGTYAVGREQLTERGKWMAAVLAGPAGGALGRISAAVFRELLQHDVRTPHVIVPASASGRGPSGIRVCRSIDLTEEDVEVIDGIRVTTVLRTLIDLSRSPLQDRLLNAAVRQAGRVHRADLQQLRGRPRLDRIVRLFDPLVGLTESDFEAVFLGMCQRQRLPLPSPQVAFGRRRADFTWPQFRLVVECQSRRWHDNAVSYQDDRAKARALQGAGFVVLPFTWAEVMYTPASVAREIRAVMRQRVQFGAP
jgi:very-short-patch-repair endonuclease